MTPARFILLLALIGCPEGTPTTPVEADADTDTDTDTDADTDVDIDAPFAELDDACAETGECLEGDCLRAPICISGMPPPTCDNLDCDNGVCSEDECGWATCIEVCSTAGCAGDEVCGPLGLCEPASCEDDGFVCPDDWQCTPGAGADAHGCVPDSCSDAFVCDGSETCDPGSPLADVHGCSVETCSAPADCQTQRCEGGFCRPVAIGTCRTEPYPLPP